MKADLQKWAKDAAVRIVANMKPRFGANRQKGNKDFAKFYKEEQERALEIQRREKSNSGW